MKYSFFSDSRGNILLKIIESASTSISKVSNNKNLSFSSFLIGMVALTSFSYLLMENCSSPIFDLNLFLVAALIAA